MPIVSLPAIVVNVVALRLFAVQKFRKIDLDLKN